MMHAEWLPIVMQGSFSEIYVIDCETLRFVEVNQAACANLQYDASELLGKTPADISRNLALGTLESALQPLRRDLTGQAALQSMQVRKDGTAYPIEFHLYHCASPQPVFIFIGNDVSFRYEAAEELRQSEARFHTIVSNTPGLFFTFLLHADHSNSFPYLSEGCYALLGIPLDRLRNYSELFLALIVPEDRQSYLDSMNASAAEMKGWNWEGRIWIEEWKDIKWINLRATPHALPDGGVQWEGIMTNITDSKLEQAEIERSRTQLAELSAHVETVKEQERTRIAREIHDELGGNLTAIKMALALLTRRLPEEDGPLVEKAVYVDSLVDRTIEAVHRISGDLRPVLLDLGLVAAIDWQAKEFEKQLGIPCEFSSNQEEINLHLNQATALFRILQEALTNISKHAQASHVTVKLVGSKRCVQLEIVDNGKGMAESDRLKPNSFGIRGMNERANALGGILSIGAAQQGGTIVNITIPMVDAPANDMVPGK
jgi:two-component system sensor histidine kinase UhpB